MFPVVLWLVPHERRADLVMRAWQEAWPSGKWLITTDERLQQDRWTEYYAGQVRERGLFRTGRGEQLMAPATIYGRAPPAGAMNGARSPPVVLCFRESENH